MDVERAKKLEIKKIQKKLTSYAKGEITFNYFIKMTMEIEEFYRIG